MYYPTYPPQRCEVVRVKGRPGAETYQLAPSSSILLLDETAPVVWLKSTDGAGYPTLTPYEIAPYEEKPPVDLSAIITRIEELEAKVNAKSDVTATKLAD